MVKSLHNHAKAYRLLQSFLRHIWTTIQIVRPPTTGFVQRILGTDSRDSSLAPLTPLPSREAVAPFGLRLRRSLLRPFPRPWLHSSKSLTAYSLIACLLAFLSFGQQAQSQTTNTNTVTNGGTIGSGTTSLITNPVTTIAGAIIDNGQLLFGQSNSTVTDAFVISGSGSLTMVGSGTTILSGANTYSGGTYIASNSTIQVGSSSTASLGAGTVTDNGSLIYNYTNLSSTITLSTPITGSGSVTISAPSTLITGASSVDAYLSASNSFTGGLTVTGGTIFYGASDGSFGATNSILTMDNAMLYAAHAGFTMGSNRGDETALLNPFYQQ